MKYCYLGAFDKAMIELVKGIRGFEKSPIIKLWDSGEDQILAFMRKDFIFIFNFSPTRSYEGYGILAPKGSYRCILDSDQPQFGGYARINQHIEHFTQPDPLYKKDKKEWLLLYLPARTAMVMQRQKKK